MPHLTNLRLQDAVDLLAYVFPQGSAVITRAGWPEPCFTVKDRRLMFHSDPLAPPEPALPVGETLLMSKDWEVRCTWRCNDRVA